MTAFVVFVAVVAVIGVVTSLADLRDRRRPDVPVSRQRMARLHVVDDGHTVPRRTPQRRDAGGARSSHAGAPLRAVDNNVKENRP